MNNTDKFILKTLGVLVLTLLLSPWIVKGWVWYSLWVWR
jgi:hypothetical protein